MGNTYPHRVVFENAQSAFEYFYKKIMFQGSDWSNTKALFNQGFTILNPEDRSIDTPWRKWNPNYAEAEWLWYMSGNPSIDKLGELYGMIPKIWEQICNEHRLVNSNYGYQWDRNGQLQSCINELKGNWNTRKASISLFDGKEYHLYGKDTVCTYGIGFTIVDGKLNMTVTMRSNDLITGFCNDQYCFSKLQSLVAVEVGVEVGNYFHFAQNLHIYPRHYDIDSK